MVFGWCPWFFKVVSWFFMVFGWFPLFFKVSRWIFIVINGPRLVKSVLSAAGAKWDVKNTKKVLTSSVFWPHDPARPRRPQAGFGLVKMMMIYQKYKTARGQQSCVSTLIQRPSLSQDYPGPALHQDLPKDLPFQQSAFVQDCSGFKEDLQSQKCTNICSGFYGHAWGNHQITACLTV